MNIRRNLVTEIIRSPEQSRQYSLAEWDLLIRQARFAELLGRIAVLLQRGGLLDTVPAQPRVHLESAICVVEKHAQVVRFEVAKIAQAVATLNVPVVLLKGAAYLMADLPPAAGRLFSDIDILVPKERLAAVENGLMLNGWMTTHHDAYDQRYYRIWMHEIPPLQHMQRQTVLDVHHTILPPTGAVPLDPAKLFASARAVADIAGIFVLNDCDLVLHSAAHLFSDGELEHGLRDLSDLDLLLRHFSTNEDFWDQLCARAGELGLGRPLFYALRYTQRMLATPIPESVLSRVAIMGGGQLMSYWMDRLFVRALAPAHESCEDWFTPTARWLLYVRSHHLRMPLPLLIPHLVRKAFKRHTTSVPLGGDN
jgi:hypothetical protein